MAQVDNEAALSRIRQAQEEIQESAAVLTSFWDLANSMNPAYQFQRLAAEVGLLEDETKKAITELDRLMSITGSPSALRAVGETWTTHVGARASDLSGQLRKESLATDNTWTGKAADAYGEAVTLQGEALTAIKSVTDVVHTTLGDLASALELYWDLLALAAIGLAAGLASAAAAIVGGVTAPAGIKFGIGAVTAFSGAVTAATTAMVNSANSAHAQQVKLVQQLAGQRAFPNGRWPSAVPERFADASTKDGDKSDWEPK